MNEATQKAVEETLQILHKELAATMDGAQKQVARTIIAAGTAPQNGVRVEPAAIFSGWTMHHLAKLITMGLAAEERQVAFAETQNAMIDNLNILRGAVEELQIQVKALEHASSQDE